MAVSQELNPNVWSAWLHAVWNLGDAARRYELLRAIGDVDVTALQEWRDPLMFLEPLDEAVSAARYWQPPHDQDVIGADPDVVESLRPLAAALAASPAAAWWTTPLDLTALRYTSFYDDEPSASPQLFGSRERLNRWRTNTFADERDAARDRPADPAARFSGNWWSTPALASLVTTTRALPGLGSVGMSWREDSGGQSNAAVWPLMVTRAPRVWEIDGPSAWTEFVSRYPMDVTSARRHDWFGTTGRVGTWLIPNWSEVAADWDGVHLTVAGYLTTATRALSLTETDTEATVLAGWNPDETWWLTDVLERSAQQPDLWHRTDDDDGQGLVWRRGNRS